MRMLNESKLDVLFRAAAECAEEAVLNSMVCAQTVVGYQGNRRESLAKYLHSSVKNIAFCNF